MSEHGNREWRLATRREMLSTALHAFGGAAILGVGVSAVGGCQATAPDRARSAVAPGAPVPVEVPEMSRAVQRVVQGVRRREGGGFIVRRPFPTVEVNLIDPFLLLDEMGPTMYGPGEALGAPSHPHRGFETVTYVLDGEIHHRDSMGHQGSMGPGGVQWMTAGSGVVHSELPSDEMLASGGRMHGFQLWVNLPADLKMMTPSYQELLPEAVPVLVTEDQLAVGRIVAGEALGVTGSIQTTLPTSYHHWTLKAGAVVTLPIAPAQRVAAYVFKGVARLGDDALAVAEGGLAVFGEGEVVRLGAGADSGDAELLLMAAAPLNEPVARRGPFVMNTEAEIQQAYYDYRNGRMGQIPPG